MGEIKVLDCTLRDGGYINEWNFGYENIRKVIRGLEQANLDLIECGYLTKKYPCSKDDSRYSSIWDIGNVLEKKKEDVLYVCMINYGEFDSSDLPEKNETVVDGIRVAFHKKDKKEGLKLCDELGKKGYLVFVQPMVSLSYTDEEILDLLKEVNQIQPYAFYLVDSFGVISKKELTRLFYLVDHNLNRDIILGYHAHNNFQLAYSNAQSITGNLTKRTVVIDTSIFGMGRGAGNLNTELFLGYLNEKWEEKYQIQPVLGVIDEVLNDIYQEKKWGYSLPYYISASYNCHPNYAGYLSDKNSLTVEDMDAILSGIAPERRNSYSEEYIEMCYENYMRSGTKKDANLQQLKKYLDGKRVLVIGPGKSADSEYKKIVCMAKQQDVVTISINFDYSQFYNVDFIFASNLRRFRELPRNLYHKVITTSNIQEEGVYLCVEYAELVNDVEYVKDNAGMMLLKLLYQLGVLDVYLAGIDGYSNDMEQNYIDHSLKIITPRPIVNAMNRGMQELIKQYRERMKITFVTGPRNLELK